MVAGSLRTQKETQMQLRLGSLFSGFGGLDLAIERVFDARTVWVSDIEPGPCKVLARRFPGVPNLLEKYLQALAARLSRVRITCGDWVRVAGPSVVRAGSGGDGARAVFLDPPYATSGDLYTHGDTTISADVREWCKTATGLRIVLCGYDDEHAELESLGWKVAEGVSGGGAGYSTRRDNGRRERLWLSRECLPVGYDTDLFGEPA